MTGYVENTAHIGGSLVVKLSIISVLASLFFVSFVRLCILDMQRSKVLYELDVTILKLIKPSLSKKTALQEWVAQAPLHTRIDSPGSAKRSAL